MLLEKFPNVFELSVSYTTRDPRKDEKEGVHYYFVSKDNFNQVNNLISK
jgi:guanylate kinase